MTEAPRGLDRYFPPQDTLPSSKNVIPKWKQNLHQLVDELGQSHGFKVEIVSKYHEGIESWSANQDHGAQHSYDVWQGMRYLADQQFPSETRPSDQQLQAAAVLHDLFQFFTVENPRTGTPLSDNPRKVHGKVMSIAVRMYGSHAGLSLEETNDLRRSIRHHDDSYEGKLHEKMPILGRLLSDADKLYGAGFYENPRDIVRAIVERNRRGSRKANGWYLFRDDMTSEQRRRWQYGDRWNLDSLSAALHDVYGQSFYTPTAIATYQSAQEAFPAEAEKVYGQEYDETAEVLEKVSSNPNTHIALVGQNYSANRTQAASLEDLIDEARETELDLPIKLRKPGHSPRGVMLQITEGDNAAVIDPTVATYVFRNFGREKFIRHIQDAIQQFET